MSIRGRFGRKGVGGPSPFLQIRMRSKLARKGIGGAPPMIRNKSPTPVWEGLPNEVLEKGDWPKGWIKQVYQRKNGASMGRKDKYWISPIHKLKFRSMVQVKEFLAMLKNNNGNELKAKQAMKK